MLLDYHLDYSIFISYIFKKTCALQLRLFSVPILMRYSYSTLYLLIMKLSLREKNFNFLLINSIIAINAACSAIEVVVSPSGNSSTLFDWNHFFLLNMVVAVFTVSTAAVLVDRIGTDKRMIFPR